ncbi:MAG TPA: hypothetical protein PKE29_13455 [Phycisphaerales bacterium]|nr:hypothetical protein [Phycisphaerales bacterium]
MSGGTEAATTGAGEWGGGTAAPDPGGSKGPHGEGKQSQQDRLMAIALERFRISRTPKGDAFAVPAKGPNVVRMLRGGGDSLRAELADAHSRKYGKAASSVALADVMLTLQGRAMSGEPEAVELRTARGPAGEIVLDLGCTRGRVVVVRPDGWSIEASSSVLFRRTELIGELPAPERGGDIEELRRFLNVGQEDFWLFVGWCVAAFIPEIAHPVLLLTGEQATGKSTAAKLIANLIDPGPARLCCPPRDPDQWTVAASGRWVVALDNLSQIPEWLSDALCRGVTGDGRVTRKLYSDGDLHVVEFRRPILINGIDLPALRGDLGSRLLKIELERIDPTKRLSEDALMRGYDLARPRMVGALLDLLVKVLAWLPEVRPIEMPRLADFSRVLAAMDEALEHKCNTLQRFSGQESEIARDVVEGDAFAESIMAMMGELIGPWEGTAKRLQEELPKPTPIPPSWPKNAKGIAGRIRRLAPSLIRLGYQVVLPSEATRINGERLYRIAAPDKAAAANTPPPPRISNVPTVRAEDPFPLSAPPPAEHLDGEGEAID